MATQMAEKFNVMYEEVSVKTGLNVAAPLLALLRRLVGDQSLTLRDDANSASPVSSYGHDGDDQYRKVLPPPMLAAPSAFADDY
jgi:hypothetical protein